MHPPDSYNMTSLFSNLFNVYNKKLPMFDKYLLSLLSRGS